MLQTASLKAAAEQEMKAVTQAINQSANSNQNGGASAGDKTATLRLRLERAIAVMQEGLVERDTEARYCLAVD